ncbi:hypothetical protein CHS0354_003780 [Potamilus streckersoni]|uniref:Uncharacterized protein n=1 Tax=Potamilus streckersoni TaxID=2493646 RepID=A0AAE0T3G2_9BIVA|nr:hypothetical protein CHS0354_003780 [Potamilus streckersoni]
MERISCKVNSGALMTACVKRLIMTMLMNDAFDRKDCYTMFRGDVGAKTIGTSSALFLRPEVVKRHKSMLLMSLFPCKFGRSRMKETDNIVERIVATLDYIAGARQVVNYSTKLTPKLNLKSGLPSSCFS